ncbi:MAG TPA: N-acetyl-alpha-D-glucosaminyl L-malate synthase BshA [Vicinamibacterales bacterium]|nr:N-acetyl-alpha-D-glucosaminyl L-malate synthase BshA [Vicinamibacterales bacterium]
MARSDQLHVAILCYASVGGSGVVATELAQALAVGGHRVHVVSRERPFRWRSDIPGLSFVRVEMPTYPLFREPQYLLGLTNSIVRLSREHPIDIIHAHYAVPHATAAYLAREMLDRGPAGRPRTITTLHGTDITLVGSDPGYESVVAFSIERSDGVTTVSQALKQDTIRTLRIERDIQVIPNFLDCSEWRRRSDRGLRERICGPHRLEAVLTHVSNFRPVKRVEAVFEVFRRVFTRVRTALVMIGDGPDRASLEQRVANEGLNGIVQFVGEQQDLVPWLSASDVFLLASAQESFGLAALEAMACEVPVVASRVGGLPEVIDDGVTGFLCPPDAVDLMAERSLDLLTDPGKRARMGRAASERVRARFCASAIVPRYETYYGDVLAKA